MKSILNIITVVLILLSLLGCEAKTQPNIEGNNPPTETAPKSTDAAKNSSTQGCYLPPTAFSLEEYNAYIDRFIDLSPDFIHYNELEEFGSFKMFVNTTDWKSYSQDPDGRIKGDCTNYLYYLTDSTGYELEIYICPAQRYTEKFSEAEELDGAINFLTVIKKKNYYKYENIHYAFRDGALVQILFPCGQNIVAVNRPNFEPFSTYPIESNVLIEKLLSTDTAEAAVAEFNAKVAQARQEAQAEKAD